MKHLAWRPYIAEAIGTALLTCAVMTSLTYDIPIATPFIAALTLLLMVYIIGPISGSHINPAVTFGLLSVGKIKPKDGLFYIIAQVLGACLAMFTHKQLFGVMPAVPVVDSTMIAMSEAFGAFILVFGISAVVAKKVDDDMSGVVIGGSLLLGILLALKASNGVLNPAVAVGIGSVSVAYLAGPLIGGALGAWVYRWLIGK